MVNILVTYFCFIFLVNGQLLCVVPKDYSRGEIPKCEWSVYDYLKEGQLPDVLLVSLPLFGGLSDCRDWTKRFVGNIVKRKQNFIFIDIQIHHVLLVQYAKCPS